MLHVTCYHISKLSASVYLLYRHGLNLYQGEGTFADRDRGQFGCKTQNRARPAGRSREQGAGLVEPDRWQPTWPQPCHLAGPCRHPGRASPYRPVKLSQK